MTVSNFLYGSIIRVAAIQLIHSNHCVLLLGNVIFRCPLGVA